MTPSPADTTATLVEMTVDGRPWRARAGENVLEVLLRAGQDISYFCYHRQLSVAASCRQCLVKLETSPKLVPACQLTASEGLAIITQDEDVVAARRQMLEFTLVNHPIDCVICDKAGECSLQRHYMDWDNKPSLVDHPKVSKPKRVDIGRHIILDAERCILCGRCVRFCSEIARAPELCFAQRGDREVLTTAPGTRLDNPYAINTVDICPVGALTDKDFRFQSRVWDLCATRSVCTGCAAGCPMEIQHKEGRIYRLVPPKLWDMNLNWMCDAGRRTYKTVGEGRVLGATVHGRQAPLADALKVVLEALRSAQGEMPDRIGVVFDANVTNEDSCALAELAFDVLGVAQAYLAAAPDDGSGDEILRRSDPNANRRGVEASTAGRLAPASALVSDLRAQKLKLLYVIGDTLALDESLIAASGLSLLVVQASHHNALTAQAQIVLPAALWAEVEGTITNHDGTVQRLRAALPAPGQARPHWQLLTQLTKGLTQAPAPTAAKQLFERLQQRVPAFQDATWGKELPTIALRFAGRRG